MKEKIKEYIPHFFIVLMSYLLATHYLFQWWNSLLLAVVIMVLATIVRRFMIKQTFRNRMFITLLIVIVLLFIPKHSNRSDEYVNCAYKPFEIVNGSSIELEVTYQPVYYKDTSFEGIFSFGTNFVEVYDLKAKENHVFDFDKGDSQVNSVAYFDGSLYVAGFNILDWPNDELNNYAVVEIDLTTKTETTFLDIPYYTNVHVINNELYVLDEDTGLRAYKIYDESGYKDIEYVSDDYILDTYSYNEYTVIVTRENDYLLYKDGSEVKRLLSAFDLTRRYVTIDSSGIYIVDDVNNGDGYEVVKYDFTGTDLSTTLTTPEMNDYIIKTDKYYVYNDGFFSSEFITLSSVVTKQNGRAVCNESYTDDMTIYMLNDKLYGEVDNYLYEVEEKTYSVPIKWNDPQSGFFYTLAIISILVYINKREKFSDMNFRSFNFGNMGSNFAGRGFNINDFINQDDDDDTPVYGDYEN